MTLKFDFHDFVRLNYSWIQGLYYQGIVTHEHEYCTAWRGNKKVHLEVVDSGMPKCQ